MKTRFSVNVVREGKWVCATAYVRESEDKPGGQYSPSALLKTESLVVPGCTHLPLPRSSTEEHSDDRRV